jgi:hypothetical protein
MVQQFITENTKRVECYDPKTNAWMEKCPLNERRYRPGVAVVGGKIYACGGEEGCLKKNVKIIFMYKILTFLPRKSIVMETIPHSCMKFNLLIVA